MEKELNHLKTQIRLSEDALMRAKTMAEQAEISTILYTMRRKLQRMERMGF